MTPTTVHMHQSKSVIPTATQPETNKQTLVQEVTHVNMEWLLAVSTALTSSEWGLSGNSNSSFTLEWNGTIERKLREGIARTVYNSHVTPWKRLTLRLDVHIPPSLQFFCLKPPSHQHSPTHHDEPINHRKKFRQRRRPTTALIPPLPAGGIRC